MAAEPREVAETFAFACGNCGHAWEAGFRVMFFTDPLDTLGLTTQEYVDEAGRAVRSPLTEAVCPECGGRRVQVRLPGHPLSRPDQPTSAPTWPGTPPNGPVRWWAGAADGALRRAPV